MDKSELMKRFHVTLFMKTQTEGENPIFRALWDKVGIYRLMWRVGRPSVVIFECDPKATEFFEQIEELEIEVKHNEYGLLDNPFAGDLVCTLRNIRPLHAWINRLTSIEFDGSPITFHFHAECDIEWTMFEMFNIPEEEEDES